MSSNKSQQPSTQNPTNKATSQSTKAEYKAPSTYKIIKDGWGSRPNFQASYGLGMDPDGIEEGNRILNGYREMDRMTWEAEQGNKIK